MTGVIGLRPFERGVIVVGDTGAIAVPRGAGMVMMMMFVLVLVVVVVAVSVPRQLVAMHVEIVTARVRVEDKPGAWYGDTRDKKQNSRRRETAGPDTPPLHDSSPLPHLGSAGHVVHTVVPVYHRPVDWRRAGRCSWPPAGRCLTGLCGTGRMPIPPVLCDLRRRHGRIGSGHLDNAGR
jgi:hypothetical protein